MRGQRALASHLPAKPTWWQQGLCHFGVMNIHHWQVMSNTYMAVNPERCTLVNLITRWWKGDGEPSTASGGGRRGSATERMGPVTYPAYGAVLHCALRPISMV